jgi:phosphoribosylformylglycinamidine cyclo-ligase
MDYKESGVDIEKADAFVEDIKTIASKTFNKHVLKGIGLFGSFFKIPQEWMPPYMINPVLVSSTDGVGTKIKIACVLNRHEGIGQDLVAMCVNDILTSGAIPMFFLDYYAVGKLDEKRDRIILNSIADACQVAGCALIGGETAEMPGFYTEDKYDLSGFVVGFASEDLLIDGSNIKAGHKIIGIGSNGVHSNGFSLIRKILEPECGHTNLYKALLPDLSNFVGVELLKPTYIYVKCVTEILENYPIYGMAHITGGGIYGNLNRIIPEGLSYHVDVTSWEIPKIFNVIQIQGDIDSAEMFKVFNMGIGYTLVVHENNIDNILDVIKKHDYKGYVIGEIIDSQDA